MDLTSNADAAHSGGSIEKVFEAPPQSPRKLPDDLPTSLDDRRTFSSYGGETEMYDAWQGSCICFLNIPLDADSALLPPVTGSSQYITTPIPAKPLVFDLHLDTPTYDDEETTARLEDSDSRLMEMLAAQAHHREDGYSAEDEDAIVADDKLSVEEKKEALQKSLNMAASNGDVKRVCRLVGGPAKDFVDVNAPDDEGTVPLIYASCFVRLGQSFCCARGHSNT